ncbi:MAG: hypothetical protein ACLRUM_07515 [Veillonella parvula]
MIRNKPLNKLAPIFDKKNSRRKTNSFLSASSDHGYKLIGDIAVSCRQKKYVILAESAENANNEKISKRILGQG